MAWREIQGKTVRWTDISSPTPEQIESLRERFGLLPIHLQDVRSIGQRPKLDVSANYLFLVLIFPIYNRATREIVPSEIDFIVGKDSLVTVHDGSLESLNELVTLAGENDSANNRTLQDGPMGLVYTCLDRLISGCNPMLDHMSRDLRTIEQKIFSGAERDMVSDILISRRNITDFRKIMQAHKNTLKKLIYVAESRQLFSGPAQASGFYQLVEQTKEIWEHLASFKETIEALHQTNETLISYHLNVIMKNYTTFSVIIFAMTFLATMFAIEVHGTPLLHLPFGFWYIVLVEAGLATGLYLLFKRNRWV